MVKGTENEVLAEIESIKESLSRVEKLVSAEGAGNFDANQIDAATYRTPDANAGRRSPLTVKSNPTRVMDERNRDGNIKRH